MNSFWKGQSRPFRHKPIQIQHMKKVRKLNARLNEIEADCQREYFAMDEYANCEEPVWDLYVEAKEAAYTIAQDAEEKKEVINSVNVEDFVDWLRANVTPDEE